MPSTLTDVVAFGTLRNGRLFVRNRRTFDTDLRAAFKEGDELELEVSKLQATRSSQANAYYWSTVLGVLSDYTGHTPTELHEYFKLKLIPQSLLISNAQGEVVDERLIPGSTRKMKVSEFYEFVERVRAFAGELGCVIPDPQGRYDAPEEQDHADV